MPSGSLTKSINCAGYGFSGGTTPVEYDGAHSWVIPLPVGNLLTAWVKTDADTAAGNLTSGHGKTSGVYDVYWLIATVAYARYGVTVTITTNACALDGGAGDSFPETGDATVVITKQVNAVVNIDGDAVVLFAVVLQSTDTAAVGSADFLDAGNASIEQFDLVDVTAASGLAKAFAQTDARALLTGNVITQCRASNGSTTAAATLYVLAGIDSTP